MIVALAAPTRAPSTYAVRQRGPTVHSTRSQSKPPAEGGPSFITFPLGAVHGSRVAWSTSQWGRFMARVVHSPSGTWSTAHSALKRRRSGRSPGPIPGALADTTQALGMSYQRVHQIVDVSTGKGRLTAGSGAGAGGGGRRRRRWAAPAAVGGVLVASRSAAASGSARSASGLASHRAAPESSCWLLRPCPAFAGDHSRCRRIYETSHSVEKVRDGRDPARDRRLGEVPEAEGKLRRMRAPVRAVAAHRIQADRPFARP